jgi:hypothetical protein
MQVNNHSLQGDLRMYETRPNAILSFGDKQVEVSKERVEEILKHALATTGYNFDHYDYVKGLNDLKQAMADWKPAEIPVNTRFETIALDLDALCISGEVQDERKFGVNLFALLSPPADGEIAFGEYVRNTTLKNVKIASNSGVMLTTNSSLEFVESTACQRAMRCSVQLGIDNEEVALHLDVDKERGWMNINRSVNVKIVEIEVAITSYRRDIQIGALRLDHVELDYLAKTPEVMAELVRKVAVLGEGKRDTTV